MSLKVNTKYCKGENDQVDEFDKKKTCLNTFKRFHTILNSYLDAFSSNVWQNMTG